MRSRTVAKPQDLGPKMQIRTGRRAGAAAVASDSRGREDGDAEVPPAIASDSRGREAGDAEAPLLPLIREGGRLGDAEAPSPLPPSSSPCPLTARSGFCPRVGRRFLFPPWNGRDRAGLGRGDFHRGFNRTHNYRRAGIKSRQSRSTGVGGDWAAIPAGVGLTEQGLTEFANRCEGFKLTDADKQNIINWRPLSAADVYAVFYFMLVY
jgi:hypothetical protein